VASGVRQSNGSVVFSRYVPGDWTIPAANSRGAFLGFVSFEAMLLSPAGAVTWDTKVGIGGWGGAPVLHGSQEWVRFGFGVGVGEVHDQATGRVLRAFYSQSPPAFVGTRVVLTQDGTLTGADATTGSVFWSQAGDGYLDSPPVVAGTTAYVTSRLGSVYGFSTVTGAQTWQATLPAEGGYDDNGTLTSGFITGPMIGDGYLAVPNGHTLTVFGG
jgi:outer membrane protein assembly factor BamB